MKKKKKIALIALGLVSSIAVTYALFSTSFEVKNKFKINSGGASAEFIEEFDAPEDGEIVAGNTYNKSGKVVNTGDVGVKARAKISISWLNDADAEITQNKPDGMLGTDFAYTLNFGNTVSQAHAEAFQTALAPTDKFAVTADTTTSTIPWVYDTNDKYFYYISKDTGVVAASTTGASTESTPLLESIKFNAKLAETVATGKYYLSTDTNFTGTSYDDQETATKAAGAGVSIVYRSTSTMKYDTYQGLTLVVTLSGEMIDEDTNWDDLIQKP